MPRTKQPNWRQMPKYIITGLMKVRDVVEADDKEQAEKRFRAKYPEFLDASSTITEIEEASRDAMPGTPMTAQEMSDQCNFISECLDQGVDQIREDDEWQVT